VPQRAVTELLGKEFVTVIGADDKTEQRPVTLGDRVGPLWIVKSGLSPGERIVVEGMQKAPAGTRVAPTMITEAQLTRETAEGTVATPASPTPAPTGSQTKSPPK
jgi:membrane fusion protein (multidrug efflux system)